MSTMTAIPTDQELSVTYHVDQTIRTIAGSFRFTNEETEKLVAKKTARLIAALPYLAGCDQPERTALAHLSTYIISGKSAKTAFKHSPEDDSDIFNRLTLGMSFQGGDAMVLRRGMDLLALQMICGYDRDRTKDVFAQEYNPLNSGSWDFDSLKSKLILELNNNPHVEMDAFLSLEDSTTAFWN